MSGKRTLLGLNLAVFLMMLGVGMIVALLPQRIIDLTAESAQVGYLASAFALSYIALQLPIGNLADRFGFKLFLLIGYTLCALTGLLYYFSGSAPLYFLGRMFQGVGEAPVWALAPALLSITYPLARARAMGVYNASLHLGLTLGPLLGVLLTGVLTGNGVFLVYAGLCLAGALTILFCVEHIRVPGNRNTALSASQLIRLVKDRKTGAVLAGITFYGVGYGAFLTNIPAYLISAKQFSGAQIGLFFSLFYVAVSISQIFTGTLSDRFGRNIFIILGLCTSAASIFIFPRFTFPGVLIVLAGASLGLGVLCLSSMAYLNETVPDSWKGTISGAYYLFWGIGFFFGPITMGRLGALPGQDKGFLLLAVCLAAVAAAAVVLLKAPRQKGAENKIVM